MLETRCSKSGHSALVIGALGTVTGIVRRNLEKLGIELKVDVLQKTCLLGTARILRKVLDIQGIGEKRKTKTKKSELIWTKRRELVILGHGRWLDENTEQSGDNIKYHVKITIIIDT